VTAFLRGVWRRLRGTRGSALRAALAVAIGLFIGCQPLYGLHFVLVLLVCVPLRLDAALSYLVANISNPLVAPFLIVAEVETGSFVMSGHWVKLDVEQARATGAAGFAGQLALGGVLVGAVLALIGFGLAFALAWWGARLRGESAAASSDPAPTLEGQQELSAAIERTRRRYDACPASARYYVAGKLALDPVNRLLAELPGSFGNVLDLGCGRGQLALLLLELGRATCVVGLDSDARKVEVARRAGPEASFRVAEVAPETLERADTILLIDVLHYMPLAEQDAVLRAAAQRLAPGGRLLVRELDADFERGRVRSSATRFFEWLGRNIGMNRGRATAYRSAKELSAVLESCGLDCSVIDASDGTPLANVLLVAAGCS
jgi:uncharacterized protein (DUF2062 family)/2-polyprenyl-3-methyl-5-hydroxy-6-metoxy-1,4-benzoquinol methylase